MLADRQDDTIKRENEYKSTDEHHIQATNYKIQTCKLSTADNLQASSPTIQQTYITIIEREFIIALQRIAFALLTKICNLSVRQRKENVARNRNGIPM